MDPADLGLERLSEFVVRGHLVLLLDQSRSMERVPKVVKWLNKLLEGIPDTTRVTIVSFNGTVRIAHQSVAPSTIPPFEESRWHWFEGGYLASGSHIREAITVGAELALATRNRGIPTGMLVLTDGWSSGDNSFADSANEALLQIRESDVRFGFYAFTDVKTRPYMDALIAEIGLLETETTITYHEGEGRVEQAADHTMNSVTTHVTAWVDCDFGRARR